MIAAGKPEPKGASGDLGVDRFIQGNFTVSRPKPTTAEVSAKLRALSDAISDERARHNPFKETIRDDSLYIPHLNDASPEEFQRHFFRMQLFEREFRSLPLEGLLEIEAMRAKAEEALGEAFDLRSFNAALLSAGGNAPMAAVKDSVDRWIAATDSPSIF